MGLSENQRASFCGWHKVTKSHTGIVQEQGTIFYLLSVVEVEIYNFMLDFYKKVSFVTLLWLSNERKHQHKFVTTLTLFAEPRPQTNSPKVLSC